MRWRIAAAVLGWASGLLVPAACGGTAVTGVPDDGADAGVDSSANGAGGSGGRVEGYAGAIQSGSGGGGTGGLRGSGGAGIGGAPDIAPDSVCAEPAVAGGTRPLIVDFEGMTLEEYGVAFSLTDAGGVYGGTYAYVDASVGEGNHVYDFVAGPDSATALSVTLPGSTEWGGGFGFWIDGCPDVSVYSGITLALRSNVASGEVPVYFQVADTRSVAGGGLCTAADPETCVAASIRLTVSIDWQSYQIPWSDFTGGMAGDTPVPVDGSNWIGFEFGIEGVVDTPEDLELAIDDVALY